MGSGPALVVASAGLSHLELEWDEPRVRNFWEAIGQHHTVVRYDRQGCGLSDRDRAEFSLDSEIRTIAAIVKELGLKSFVLWGQRCGGGPEAISYAVKYPDHVSHLVLCGALARYRSSRRWGAFPPNEHDAFLTLVKSNWRMASLALMETMLGSSFDAVSQQWYFRLLQEGVTPEMVAQLLTFWWNTDVEQNGLPRRASKS
jgi:pimeloyl-ACP methyl ester carboxylesterase